MTTGVGDAGRHGALAGGSGCLSWRACISVGGSNRPCATSSRHRRFSWMPRSLPNSPARPADCSTTWPQAWPSSTPTIGSGGGVHRPPGLCLPLRATRLRQHDRGWGSGRGLRVGGVAGRVTWALRKRDGEDPPGNPRAGGSGDRVARGAHPAASHAVVSCWALAAAVFYVAGTLPTALFVIVVAWNELVVGRQPWLALGCVLALLVVPFWVWYQPAFAPFVAVRQWGNGLTLALHAMVFLFVPAWLVCKPCWPGGRAIGTVPGRGRMSG